MANNTISYNRFSALPANIAHYGTTSEELALQKGAPDPDPVLSPMADGVVPARQLALSRAGSDKLRLANPSQPMANPYEGRKPNLVHSRHAVTKLAGPVVEQLKNLVNTGAVVEGNVQYSGSFTINSFTTSSVNVTNLQNNSLTVSLSVLPAFSANARF